MKRHPLVALVLISAAAMVIGLPGSSAWGSGSREDATVPLLRVGITPGFEVLDTARVQTSSWIGNLALEPLRYQGPDGKLNFWLAVRRSQPAKKTYIYHLRKGVRFSDGTRLTAADVANAINYYRDPSSVIAGNSPTVKSVVALKGNRVAFTLKRPDATFEWLAVQLEGIFSKKFQDAHKTTLGRPGVLTVGTGPWKFTSFDPTRGVELVANDLYWGGKPQIRRISVKFFSDENSLALAFRAGEIDLAPNISGAQAFTATSGAKLISKPTCRQGLLSMNTSAPPFNDVHVRRAVAYALNRADLIKANGGYASPSDSLIPRSQLLTLGSPAEVDKLLKSLPKYAHSVAKARQEMAQSRYPNGFSTRLVEFNFGNWVIVSQAIANQLSQIGIKVDVKVETPAAWYAELTGPRDERPLTFYTNGCSSPDPSWYFYLLGKANVEPGGFNTAAWAPADVELLLAAQGTTLDPAKRLQVFGKLLRRTAGDMPYVPLWVESTNAALSSKFTWSRYDSAWFTRPWALEIKPR